MAAIQTGWLSVTRMRTLQLMGMEDPNAWKSYAVLCTLSFLFVAVTNIPLALFPVQLGNVVSNEPDVREWFDRIVSWFGWDIEWMGSMDRLLTPSPSPS